MNKLKLIIFTFLLPIALNAQVHHPSSPPEAPLDCTWANPLNDTIVQANIDSINNLVARYDGRLDKSLQCRGDLWKKCQDVQCGDIVYFLFNNGWNFPRIYGRITIVSQRPSTDFNVVSVWSPYISSCFGVEGQFDPNCIGACEVTYGSYLIHGFSSVSWSKQ